MGGLLSADERHFFRERGYLRLERAASRAPLEPLRRRIDEDLGRRGIRWSGRGIPRAITDLPVFQQITKLSQMVTVSDLEADVIPESVADVVRSLATTRVLSTQSQLLLSPPKQGDWSLDGLNWHTDVSSRAERMPGIQAFVLLRDLEDRGGATLILAGSHRFASSAEESARVREALRSGREGEAVLRDLDLSIVPLSGKAGDVYLMDLRLLHTPSINASAQLRAVATVRYFLE